MGRQWGNTDDAANSVIWATARVNLPTNTTNQTALYNNTTIGAFNNGGVPMNQAVGTFGLDVNEISVNVGNTAVAQYVIINPGSGYSANAVVTVANTTGGANVSVANSTASATGRITAITANGTPIRGYTSIPAVTIAAPTARTFDANAAVTNATDSIALTTANSFFLPGDRVIYTVAAGNTALTNLTSGTTYVIKTSNTTAVTLATGINAPTIDLTKGLTESGHSLTGETATATAVLTGRGYTRGAAHTGWVLRTVGTGGRAGRVQYETLVAFGGNMTTDGSDDAILHDT
jgi:hypothetical protein